MRGVRGTVRYGVQTAGDGGRALGNAEFRTGGVREVPPYFRSEPVSGVRQGFQQLGVGGSREHAVSFQIRYARDGRGQAGVEAGPRAQRREPAQTCGGGRQAAGAYWTASRTG